MMITREHAIRIPFRIGPLYRCCSSPIAAGAIPRDAATWAEILDRHRMILIRLAMRATGPYRICPGMGTPSRSTICTCRPASYSVWNAMNASNSRRFCL